MIEVDASDGRLRVVDAEKNEVTIRAAGWEETDTAPRLDRRVDAMVSGRTRSLTVPESAVTIESAGTDRWTTFTKGAEPVSLPSGAHVVQFETNVGVYVAFNGQCRLRRRERDESITVELDGSTPVTLGFRSQVSRPRRTITVPRSLDGAASAVRYLSSAIATSTPDKSYPTLRAHPPTIEFGEAVDIPEAVFRDASFSDVSVAIPRSLGPLLVTAPLVYYLQADVSLTDEPTVSVDAPSLPEPLVLGGPDRLEHGVAALLHRVFFLDCLVRNAGPYGVELNELSLLDRLDLDLDRLYRASNAERLGAYLGADYARVVEELPDWHLGVVVEPTLEHVRAVPYLLDRLSLVQLPAPVAVDRRALVSESIDQSYEPAGRQRADAPAYDLVRNRTRLGRVQGWMADGTPVDAFRATLASFENRFAYHERSEGPRSVAVVINDDSMLEEREAVERIYRRRAEELSIDVTVAESLPRAGLAEQLRSPVDFLHFIGHCDEDGLHCADGPLSVTELERTRVQTFFLNACGSFDQGMALVERGSVAGAVTLYNVLNPQATKVGTTFARLVMHGYSIELALALASRQSVMSKLYSVVGDGTHRISQLENVYPLTLEVERAAPDELRVRFVYRPSDDSGIVSIPTLAEISEYHLTGNPYAITMDTSQFVESLDDSVIPVVFDGGFYWADELAERWTQLVE